jgi:hypothetical protein
MIYRNNLKKITPDIQPVTAMLIWYFVGELISELEPS